MPRCAHTPRSAATSLAAERHRRKTGRWPASVAAIEPHLLGLPALDPFSGQPFCFTLLDGRLSVYSVSPNLEGEHGTYEPKTLA